MRAATTLAAMTMAAGAAFAQQSTGEEVLLSALPQAKGVEFHVRSGGCTKKAHFGVETLSLRPLTLRLVRLRPDYCQGRLTDGQRVVFSYAELGAPPTLTEAEVRRVVVVNLVASP